MNKRRRVLLIFVIVSLVIVVIYGIFAHNCPFFRSVYHAEIMSLRDESSSVLKSGYYCGEGGVKCHHGEGYIYCESGTTETDAMKMDGFVWNDENNDWDKSANHASITVKIPCLHGYLLCYRITGEA